MQMIGGEWVEGISVSATSSPEGGARSTIIAGGNL